MYQTMALMLLVDEVDEAVAWYQDVFGAKLQYSMPKTPPFEWASPLLGDIELMLSREKSAQHWYRVRFLKTLPILLSTSTPQMLIFFTIRLRIRLRSLWSP
ncbi:MAG: VOC family protein [Thermoproteota archaeon]